MVHFLCGKRFAPPQGPFLRQIFEWALDSLQRLKRREELIPDPRNESVLHLRNKDEFFLLVDAHEQRIKAACSGDVTADDKLLLHIRAKLDPGTRSLARFIDGIDLFAHNAFQAEMAHRLENLSCWRLQ